MRMHPLPFDYQRCLPQEVGEICKNCKRWFNHPEQQNNPYGQTCITVKSSNDPACDQIPDLKGKNT
jgi:hypothetical protein